MNRYRTGLIVGLGLIAVGGVCFVIATVFLTGSGGYGGAGMAGLPAAFLIIAAIGLVGLGALVAATTWLIRHLTFRSARLEGSQETASRALTEKELNR